MANPVKIPKAFYNDHAERDLPAPPILDVIERGRFYVIDADHADASELREDAEFYASNGNDAPLWLKSAAAALLRALSHKPA